MLATFEHGFNITWSTSDQMNAASLFYIKYQKKDDIASPWLRTTLTTDNFYSLTDLEPGTRYLVVLVATTGAEEHSIETESDPQLLKTTGQGILVNSYIPLFFPLSFTKLSHPPLYKSFL